MTLDMEAATIYILVALAVICAVWSFSAMMGGRRTGRIGANSSRLTHPGVFLWFAPGVAFFANTLGVLYRRLLREERNEMLQESIRRGGLALECHEVYGAQFFCCVGGLLLGMVAGFLLPARFSVGLRLAPVLLLGIAGFALPRATVERAAAEREDEILRHLPFALDLLASSMRAGLDFNSALRYLVTLDSKNALHREFAIYLQETELGKTRTEALQAMEKRICVQAFSRFVTAVSFGMERGSSIIELMVIQAEEMRNLRQNRAEKAAAKAPGKMLIPMMIFILPSVFIVLLFPTGYKLYLSGLFKMFHH